MTRRRIVVLVVSVAALVALLVPVSASAWHYTFKQFLKSKGGTIAGGVSKVERCKASLSGEYRFSQIVTTDVKTSGKPMYQGVELLVTAKMPITTKFLGVHDVEVNWTATLPKDPGQAALMEKFYNDLAEGQGKFFEGMSVKWLPGAQKLLIRHGGLSYNGNPVLEPGEATTPFKPKPGC